MHVLCHSIKGKLLLDSSTLAFWQARWCLRPVELVRLNFINWFSSECFNKAEHLCWVRFTCWNWASLCSESQTIAHSTNPRHSFTGQQATGLLPSPSRVTWFPFVQVMLPLSTNVAFSRPHSKIFFFVSLSVLFFLLNAFSSLAIRIKLVSAT